MSMNLRYEGGFNSLSGTLYGVKIYQEGYTGEASPVAFCDDPLEIEWPEVDKLEPVMSSNATLKLYSDDDRQFTGLYTVVAGSVRMDVYRDGSLYWSGTLDPELYTEPFAYKTDYGVELTFADMAILDRLAWDREGFMTLREAMEEILSRAGFIHGGVEEHASTALTTGTAGLLDAVSVNCANFYDEDGEPMTLREVLDEMLRPFALRMVQKGGKVVLYDLNAIYTAFEPQEIGWESDDSTLSVDKVYNNVKLTYSPYMQTEVLSGEVDPDSIPSAEGHTVWINRNSAQDEKGFTIYLSDTGKGLEKSSRARFFRIDPVHSGSDDCGVAWTVETFAGNQAGEYVNYVQEPTYRTQSAVLKVPGSFYISPVANKGDYRLKVSLSLLFDVRYNPYEEASKDNEEGNYGKMKDWCNFVYVPVKVLLRDKDGNVLYHWRNRGVKDSTSFAHTASNCYWAEGEGSGIDSGWQEAWLCWYEGNRKNETGVGGWQQNKQTIGYYRGEKLPVLFDKMDKAEYIDLPPVAGWIEFQVGEGVYCYDYGSSTTPDLKGDIYPVTRWVLYKSPSVTLVDKYGKSIVAQDVELKAWLNRNAKEELSVDTVLGTLEGGSPVAKGQLFLTSGLSPVTTFQRAGTSDRLEKLLIGTVYSNYASPHRMLSGTVSLLPAFGTYTDLHEPGKYVVVMETQRLCDDESNIKMVQFDADSYEGILYITD